MLVGLWSMDYGFMHSLGRTGAQIYNSRLISLLMEAPQETVPVNVQLQEILKTTDKEELVRLLKRLTAHKHINYQKVCNHVTTFLKTLGIDYQQSLEMLTRMTPAFSQSDTRPFMSQNIFRGFEAYWKQLVPPLTAQQKTQGIGLHEQMHTSFVEEFVTALWNEQYVTGIQQRLIEEVWDSLRKKELFVRGLKLVRCFKLLGQIDQEKLADWIARSTNIASQLEFFFKDAPKPFIKLFCSMVEKQSNFKLCSEVVQKYELPHTEFPAMMWELEKGHINYYIREYPLYAAELKFQHDEKYLSYFVSRLFSRNLTWAESLLRKYNLYSNEVFEIEGHQNEVRLARSRRDTVKKMKNVLVEMDAFGATELRVLGQPVEYIELEDLLLTETDVLFVDSTEDEHFLRARKSLLESELVGIDCQFDGAVTKFDQTFLNIIQFATRKQVFIFDYRRLKDTKPFMDFIKELLLDTPTITFLLFGGKEDLSLIRASLSETDRQRPIKYIDLQSQMNAKEKEKCPLSLKKVAEELFGKKFSKFEQCSAWNSRPLRKAQLHYAALDARILLDIYDNIKAIKPAAKV